MNGTWKYTKDSLKPSHIRPEAHWLEEVRQGGSECWFSLQLSRNRAEELCDAFVGVGPGGDFQGLIDNGALLAPSSYKALRFAIAAATLYRGKNYKQMDRMLGVDLFVPPVSAAYDALQRLVVPGSLEITDAGFALGTKEAPARLKLVDPDSRLKSAIPQGPIPAETDVIIAVIDDGVAIANNRFRKTINKTRIKHFLDLSLIGSPTARGAVDELLGRSWTAGAINALLEQYPDDEEGVYRALGLIDPTVAMSQPLRAAVSHGTHVLDTAAGYDWQTQDTALLKARPIIVVQPPIQAADNRSDPWMPESLKRALDWILVTAIELSAKITGSERRLPLIVNCSFASIAGPKDGWSDVERRITQFVRTYRAGGPPELCNVVMSASNSLQFRATARARIERNRVSVPWRVLPDDKTPSFVQIWLPRTDTKAQQVRVALRPPGQDKAEKFSKLNKTLDWTVGDAVRARLYHQSWPRPDGKRRECITIAIRATDEDGAPEPVVPAGLWHIDIEPATVLPEPLDIDLHVNRDDVGIFARGKGRQSYFDDPDYPRADLVGDYQRGKPVGTRRAADSEQPRPDAQPLVRPQGTLNAYGFGEGTLLVAGYRASDGIPAAYSASGAAYMPRRSKGPDGKPLVGPDLAAVSDASPSLPGILGTGTYSGSVARLNGTSVATPQAVRQLADEIAAGGSLETLEINTGQPQGVAPGEPPANRPLRLGAGLLPFRSLYGEATDILAGKQLLTPARRPSQRCGAIDRAALVSRSRHGLSED
jgi:hypothetical protein